MTNEKSEDEIVYEMAQLHVDLLFPAKGKTGFYKFWFKNPDLPKGEQCTAGLIMPANVFVSGRLSIFDFACMVPARHARRVVLMKEAGPFEAWDEAFNHPVK